MIRFGTMKLMGAGPRNASGWPVLFSAGCCIVAYLAVMVGQHSDGGHPTGTGILPALRVYQLEPVAPPVQSVRRVNPSVSHIASWISSVGSGVALGDLDGDGLPQELCIVDPRSDVAAVASLRLGDDGPACQTIQTLISPERAIVEWLHEHGVAYSPEHMAPTGCRIADLNEDGRTDVLVYFWGRPPILFLNLGSRYEPGDLIPQRGPVPEIWNTCTLVVADFDGDGYSDLFVGNYFPDETPVLDTKSPVKVAMNASMSRALNGGTNRILLRRPGAGEGMRPRFDQMHEPFTADEARGWTLAAAAVDLDGDALPELYVANDFGPDRLFHNRSEPGRIAFSRAEGQRSARDPSSTVLGRDSFKGMGVDIADLNQDGVFDIFVSNITTVFGLHEPQLAFLGTGNRAQFQEAIAPFEEQSEEFGLARTAFSWDCKLTDLNNDGQLEVLQASGFIAGVTDRWPELQELALSNDHLLANPSFWPDLTDADISGHEPRILMMRQTSGRFVNVAEPAGLTRLGVSRGLAVADIDGDGDLDWIEANQWAPFRLIINQDDGRRAFLGLRLLLERASTSGSPNPRVEPGRPPMGHGPAWPALNAAVTVYLPDGRHRIGHVDGGSGHGGQRSAELHFGLGTFSSGSRLEVRVTWRDSRGTARHDTLYLPTGWHTVYLPW